MPETIQKFGDELRKNIPGYIAACVTEIATGISYYSNTVVSGFDPELAAVFNLEVVKAKLKAIQILGLDEKIQDILITLTSQIHIIDVSDSGAYMIYLAVDSNKANLGMTRTLLNRYKKTIKDRL